MAYCIYLRKSRADVEAEARGEGETLARHERALLELAKRLRLNVTQIYREIVSGETIAARPVMQELLSAVEQEVWEGVLVMEVERLARGDTIDQGIVAQTFKYSGTKIFTPAKTYDPSNEFDEEYFEFGLFMSRREYKTINRRLQRGRLASVKEGKYASNKAPYGYRRVKLERDKGWTLEVVPEEADVVRRIFELYTVGELLPDGTHKRLGVNLIARRLDELHIPTKSGCPWSPGTVREMLTNPAYIGKVRWKYRQSVKKMVDGKVVKQRNRSPEDECVCVDGLHEAIISSEVFEAAQGLMSKNPPRPVGEARTVKNPLAGVVVCGVCGRTMVRRPVAGREGAVLMCPASGCPNVSCDLSIVEGRILAGLSEWLSGYQIEIGVSSPRDDGQLEFKKKAAKRLAGELEKLGKQLDNIHDLLEQGVYSTDKFLERSRLLAERIQQTQASLAAAEEDVALEEAREESRVNIVPKVERLLDVYALFEEPKAKNELLRDVLEKVVYLKTSRDRRRPADFSLELFPKLPDSSGSASE